MPDPSVRTPAAANGTKRGRRTLRLVTALVATVLSLACLEILLRGAYALENTWDPDRTLRGGPRGWYTTPDLEDTYRRGAYGTIHYSTGPYGFRRYGDPATSRTKVFVIGDSFTQAIQVSDGETYFDVLQESRPNLEIFAYGAGGYGTLQELMVLEEFRDRIDPDLILWQFCSNDFLNNDHALESASHENDNHMRRPYLEAGGVVYRHPDGALGLLAEHSFLARRGLVLLDSVAKRVGGTVEPSLGPGDPRLARSVATTRRLLARAVEVARAPIVLFGAATEGTESYPSAFRELCSLEGIHCVPDLSPALDEARRAGRPLDGGDDPHWNARGHAVVGHELAAYLERSGLLPPP